jgi:hypothetical protein
MEYDSFRQFFDIDIVMRLDVFHSKYVLLRHEIDGNAFSPPPSTSADAMQIGIHGSGNIEIDDGVYLLDVDSSSGDIR